ncbi:MAG TPA: TonB-dependent receptor, partial [Vicinamibacterales bacterium]|nr:TonB-dependent receptor [Vicinamibacterales bacterium]
RLHVTGRLDHALTKSHLLRSSLVTADSDRRNLGVGNFDLDDRAYSRRTRDRILRFSESGPWGRSIFAESRLQLRWQSTGSSSVLEAPTVKVLDAFTSGGAQQAGERRATGMELATDVDWTRGRHAVRAGLLVEAGWYRSDTWTNYLGTFTFTSLADFEAGRPANWTRRGGDPRVTFSQWQAGIYIQDDWRVRQNLTVSAGLRQEVQTNLGDRLNLAPRFGITWSPFTHGRTTVRAGGGIFYEWLDAEIFEQTLRVDGVHQRDLVVTNPGYPDPLGGGAAQEILPGGKYVLSPDLVMPTRVLTNVGVSHRFLPTFSLNVSYSRSRGYDRFRGRNINAPDASGNRPDPTIGTVTQVESTAGFRGDTISAGINFNVPARRMFMFANYAWMRQENDADGAFSLPAGSYDLAAEWGPVTGVPRHMVSAMLTTSLWKNLRVGVNAIARSGAPYNITTGRDDNGDTVFNDRPSGVGRNSARGEGMWDVSARVGYTFGFGDRPVDAGGTGTPTVVVHRAGGSGSDLLGALGGGGAEDKRFRIELFATASNLFNVVNSTGYSGVMTSPFFLQPTAAMSGRRIDVGLRMGF